MYIQDQAKLKGKCPLMYCHWRGEHISSAHCPFKSAGTSMHTRGQQRDELPDRADAQQEEEAIWSKGPMDAVAPTNMRSAVAYVIQYILLGEGASSSAFISPLSLSLFLQAGCKCSENLNSTKMIQESKTVNSRWKQCFYMMICIVHILYIIQRWSQYYGPYTILLNWT